jgi:hypothetical protein
VACRADCLPQADVSYRLHRWYEPQTGRYTSPDPLLSERAIWPYAYGDDNPLQLIDPLGLVSSEAECGCCSLADISRELGQIRNFMRTQGRNYRKPWLSRRLFTYGCGNASDSAVRDIDKQVNPKCWITRSQKLAPGRIGVFGNYVWVHFVPTFRPCGSHGAPGDDLEADPYWGDDEVRPARTHQWVDDLECPAWPGPGLPR